MTTTNDAPAPAPSGSGVRVKPLSWSEPSKANNGCWTAQSILGTFSVGFDDGWHASIDDCMRWEWEPENDPRSYEGPFAAQAACQAFLDSRILSALASDASPRGEAVAWREQDDGWRYYDRDSNADLVEHIEQHQKDRHGVSLFPLYAHPAPATVESFPRLTDAMIRAACKAHYGSDEIDGIAMTVRSHDYNFRQAFKRMWKGARRAALAPATEGRKG